MWKGFGNGHVLYGEEEIKKIFESFDPSLPKMPQYEAIALIVGLSAVTVQRMLKGHHWAARDPSRKPSQSSE